VKRLDTVESMLTIVYEYINFIKKRNEQLQKMQQLQFLRSALGLQPLATMPREPAPGPGRGTPVIV
jgi:hypothetical protein